MKAPATPAEEARIRAAFEACVNMDAAAIEAWLLTPQSRAVGVTRPGESESVGRQAGRRIVEILATETARLTPDDHAHMRQVTGYVRRHRAQRPRGDIGATRWRYALMNWGHDPVLAELPVGD